VHGGAPGIRRQAEGAQTAVSVTDETYRASLLRDLRRISRALARLGVDRDVLVWPAEVGGLSDHDLGVLVRAQGSRLAKLAQIDSEAQ
jgi:hypothetical protein